MKEVQDTESEGEIHGTYEFFFFLVQVNPFKTKCKLFYLMTQFMLHS